MSRCSHESTLGEITTQPGYFCSITGDGISVGRDNQSAVTPEYQAPFTFTGGAIDKVRTDGFLTATRLG
jgi:arylsulfatase